MGKLSVRGGFSDRAGTVVVPEEIQITSFDKNTKTYLANTLINYLDYVQLIFHDEYEFDDFIVKPLTLTIEQDLFHRIIDRNNLPSFTEMRSELLSYIIGDGFDDTLTTIEFFSNQLNHELISSLNQGVITSVESVFDVFNRAFEINYVGYRFINGQILQISDKNQIDAVEKGIKTGGDPASHLGKALAFLSVSGQHDYPNSIKESITAVESECEIIVGKKTTLGEALKQLETDGSQFTQH